MNTSPISAATLNGNRATHARSNLPAWGVWSAEASLDGEVTITGAVTLAIADLTLVGTVLSGGPAKGRSFYRIVGGFGAWGKTVPQKSYANDAGVKYSTVLLDVAAACGETIDPTTIPVGTIGPAWTRKQDVAARVLELLFPNGWYVGEDGVTRIGKRPPLPPVAGTVTRITQVDLARATLTVAAESIANILPGFAIDGLTAVDVQHEISAEGGLRSTIWGSSAMSTGNRRRDLYQKLFAQLFPDIRFRGVTEYRVVTQDGERLNLQAVRVSTGMPDLQRVYVRPGIAGARADAALGARVLVGFIEADPSRPFVQSFEDAEGSGFTPMTIEISASEQANVNAPVVILGAGELQTGVATAETTESLFTLIETLVVTSNALAIAVNNIVGTPNVSALSAPAAIDPTPSPLSAAVTTAFGAYQTAAAAVETALPAPTNFSQTVDAAS